MVRVKGRIRERDGVIGARVREIRQVRGVTQGVLAKKLGISPQQLQKYESGANKISASRIEIVAAVLDVPVSVFFQMPGRGGKERLETLTQAVPGRQAQRLMQAFHGIASRRLRALLVHNALVFAEEKSAVAEEE